jgi:PTS system fructose-specific IIA component/PTS system nitrogen regulatory IIA component
LSDPASDLGFPVVDLPPSAGSSPEVAVRFLVGQLVESGRLRAEHAERVTCQVLRRESQGSTGIGRGVAVPHSKSDAVDRVLGIVGRSGMPVVWPGALDAVPVRIVCLLVTPASDPRECLRALETVVRRLQGDTGKGRSGPA